MAEGLSARSSSRHTRCSTSAATPYYRGTGNGVAIVAKGTDAEDADAAIVEVTQLMMTLGGMPIPGEPPAA